MEHAVLPAWALVAYLVSGVLFILALRGLSSPATSRTGNRQGMAGMALAVLTTLVTQAPIPEGHWWPQPSPDSRPASRAAGWPTAEAPAVSWGRRTAQEFGEPRVGIGRRRQVA